MGDVLLAVSVPSNPSIPTKNFTYYQLMEITGGLNTFLIPSTPTNPSGLTTPAVTVPRGTSFQFYGGAIGNSPCGTAASCATQAVGYQTLGSVDNTVIWEAGANPSSAVVGGITGTGSYGTVSTSGLYTAPSVSPTGTFPFTSCVVMAAHALSTKTNTAYITVN